MRPPRSTAFRAIVRQFLFERRTLLVSALPQASFNAILNSSWPTSCSRDGLSPVFRDLDFPGVISGEHCVEAEDTAHYSVDSLLGLKAEGRCEPRIGEHPYGIASEEKQRGLHG